MPGIGELIIILVIILIVFGAGKLPQIGDALGRSIRNFKRASSGSEEVEVGPKAKEISTADEPAADEPAADEPAADEPAADDPASKDEPADKDKPADKDEPADKG